MLHTYNPWTFYWYYVTDEPLVASDGSVFERAITNAECCSEYSILESEDGTNLRWPLLYFKEGTGTFDCAGGTKRTYQEWIDHASDNSNGICVEGWSYFLSGIWKKCNCILDVKTNV